MDARTGLCKIPEQDAAQSDHAHQVFLPQWADVTRDLNSGYSGSWEILHCPRVHRAALELPRVLQLGLINLDPRLL